VGISFRAQIVLRTLDRLREAKLFPINHIARQEVHAVNGLRLAFVVVGPGPLGARATGA
jgi:hypothetical protein